MAHEAVEQTYGPSEGHRPMRPLSQDEVKSIVSHEIMDSHGAISAGSQISEERRKALRYYYGRSFGNEVEGRSQVVLTEVADTIHWMMPSLMRMFFGPNTTWVFEPSNPDEIEAAEEATAYVNATFRDDMNGYQILYDWFFTALLEKNGFVIAYYEEKIEPRKETFYGLSPEEFQMLIEDGRNGEVIEFSQNEDEFIEGPDGPVPLIDCTIQYNNKVGKIKVDGIPPEEALVARRTIILDDDAKFCGQRKKMTVSDLIAMGYDPKMVDELPTDESPEFSQGRTIRLSEEETFPISTAERADAASREIWVNNCFLRIDEDGDGYAELRNIVVVGDTSMEIISDEEVNWMPISSLTAVPVPHKFFGQSVADLVGDLQVIRSTLMRQMLDNIYLQNNSRHVVIEGAVEIDDLLTSYPGGVIRATMPDAVTPLITQPLGPAAMQMMEYLEDIREVRTGVTRYSQGLDAGSLNATATGVSAIMSASHARIELIARTFAETGMKQLGRNLLRLMKENYTKPRRVKLRGKWTNIDPSKWNENMTVKVKVGLGVGAASERIGFVMQVLGLQNELMKTGGKGMVTQDNVYRAASEITEAMGFQLPDMFFTDPNGQQWPEEPPNPKILESERRSKEDSGRLKLDFAKIADDVENNDDMMKFRYKELEDRIKVDRERIEMEERVRMAQVKAQVPNTRSDDDDGPSASE